MAIHFVAGGAPKGTEPEGQPLGANAQRLLQALVVLGQPLPEKAKGQILEAAQKRDAAALQQALDPQLLFIVSINPELRVKVARGPSAAVLHQNGFTPVLIKVQNDAKVSLKLNIESAQAGPVYAGAARPILERQQQTELAYQENSRNDPGRFLQLEIFSAPLMTERLSGLELEYAIALIYSTESGKREATVGFNVGQGTQDLGFRAETPVLFDIAPAINIKLSITAGRDFEKWPRGWQCDCAGGWRCP